MNMKDHILMALKEQFESWVALIRTMDEGLITTARFDYDWSIKDVMIHLWGWQQISVARIEAAVQDRQPQFPKWITGLGEGWEENVEQANAWMKQSFQDLSWPDVYQHWRDGYLQLIDLAELVSAVDLLEGGRFDWLDGAPLVYILIASYNHHQEHSDKLMEVG